jgi:hypothetical protein
VALHSENGTSSSLFAGQRNHSYRKISGTEKGGLKTMPCSCLRESFLMPNILKKNFGIALRLRSTLVPTGPTLCTSRTMQEKDPDSR